MIDGLILKKQANIFTVETKGGNFDCVARKNLKKEGLFVGDHVLLDDDKAVAVVKKRKNLLVRPPLANLDKMFIVVAPVPKPDFYTVDKLILFCFVNGIIPEIVANKSDVDEKICEIIEKKYKKIAKTLIISAKENKSIKELEDDICEISALAGQSAVGKSSIVNALKKDAVAKVDTFSKKIERGKQTTRTVELFKFGENKYLADTAGFSKLDEALLGLEEDEIKSYYPEFMDFAHKCKYKSCAHINADNCAVLEGVKENKIDKERYENYKKLFEIVKNIKKY